MDINRYMVKAKKKVEKIYKKMSCEYKDIY